MRPLRLLCVQKSYLEIIYITELHFFVSLNAEAEVRIYPTMTNSNSTLYVEGISPENAQVELFGASGRVFHKIKMYSNTISLPGIPPGIYQVRITSIATRGIACLQKIVIY